MSEVEELKNRLEKKEINVWNVTNRDSVFEFAETYKTFLSVCKTEREVVRYVVNEFGRRKTVADFMLNNRDKSVALVRVGKGIGMRLIASHIDSPRIDIKQSPLFEDIGIALFHTHYYGGIKKYQWLNIPVAIHGIVVKGGGEKIEVVIGEDDSDPVFVIPDLLPHLSHKVIDKKNVKEAFDGDKMNLVVGSVPLCDSEEVDLVKLNVLKMLNEKYGIVEEDLITAELEVVPALKPRDLGFDRSMIAAYGQDDRICAFASLEAFFSVAAPGQTTVVLMVDKEEIGSEGNTSAQSRFVHDIAVEILKRKGMPTDNASVGEFFVNSYALSADVNGAVNPMYKDVHEKDNASYLNRGVVLTKFTGSGGKYSASDANVEYMARIRSIFNEEGIVWQTGELGKVDEGGGGTIAKFIANLNIETIDCGPALISMHSPYEVSSKADLYETYRAYCAFFKRL